MWLRQTLTLKPYTPMENVSTKINVNIEDRNNPDHSVTMALTFEDCTVRIRKGDTEYGNVTSAIGGGVRVTVNNEQTDAVVKIPARELWNVAVKVLNRQDLFIEPPEKTEKP